MHMPMISMHSWVLLLAVHGPWHARLEAVNEALERAPSDSHLLFERAELHRLDGAWDAAAADYQQVAELDPTLLGVELGRARMARSRAAERLGTATSEVSDPAEREASRRIRNEFLEHGLACIERLLAARPDHAAARLERARLLAELARWTLAVQDYDWLLVHEEPLRPDTVLEAARSAYSMAQEKVESAAQALARLDRGMERLGTLPALQLEAVEYERRRGDFAAAVGRIATVEALASRKETWQARRGELWWESGDLPRAQRAFRAARDSLRALPLSRQTTPAARRLAGRIDEALRSLEQGAAFVSEPEPEQRRKRGQEHERQPNHGRR